MAEVAGGSFYYEVAGEGPNVVLVHGFRLDARMWVDQFAVFAERYRVIRYDARGFGRSSVPGSEPYAPHRDLKALLDSLGVERASLIGLSMGGNIAAEFAAAYPESTDALVIADSALGLRWSKESLDAMQEIRAAAEEQGVEAALELWLNHPLFGPARENPELWPRLKELIAGYSWWHFYNVDPGERPPAPLSERLGQIQAPTLFLYGERDAPEVHEVAGLLTDYIPGAKQTVIPGAGHMSNMEAPDAFNRAVLDFLGGHEMIDP
ncbi:MAG: alpha/beta fold hydrolase [bacterium]|nr:alpha/beta fold hydrolase [bacterium]